MQTYYYFIILVKLSTTKITSSDNIHQDLAALYAITSDETTQRTENASGAFKIKKITEQNKSTEC